MIAHTRIGARGRECSSAANDRANAPLSTGRVPLSSLCLLSSGTLVATLGRSARESRSAHRLCESYAPSSQIALGDHGSHAQLTKRRASVLISLCTVRTLDIADSAVSAFSARTGHVGRSQCTFRARVHSARPHSARSRDRTLDFVIRRCAFRQVRGRALPPRIPRHRSQAMAPRSRAPEVVSWTHG
eukprot:1827320-Pleurochrysis_carterae.AAC.3